MFLSYTAATSSIAPKDLSERVQKVLNTPLDADISYNKDAPRREDEQKYGSSHGDDKKKEWSVWDFLVLLLIIIAIMAYVGLISTAAYTTSNSPGHEMFWSIIMAVFVPEVWACYHGIDASRRGVGFFEKLIKK